MSSEYSPEENQEAPKFNTKFMHQGEANGITVACDRCQEPFGLSDRVPTILPDCADTLCSVCVLEIFGEENPKCSICSKLIDMSKGSDMFKINQKLINLMTMPGEARFANFFPCPKHPDKSIDYFCKSCTTAVCVECIFSDHNGHHLV